MAALNFPNNPSLNQIYTANDTSWRWNGSSWVRVNLGTQGVQGTQGLQGTQGVQGTAGDTLWRQGPLGISTSENVGIATTAATAFALDVYGNARVSGILTVGSSSVIINGVNNTVNVGTSATIGTTNTFLKTSLEVTGVSTFQNNVFINGSLIAGAGGGGVSIGDDLITRNLYASGVSTFIGAIAANSATFSGNVTIGGTLKYEDVVNVDSVGIATARSGLRITGGGLDVVGVSTFAGAIDANGDLDVDGHTELDELRVTGVSTFTANLDIDAAIDVDGHTELDELNVSGVSTFAGAIDANSDLDVDGHTELDNVNISGILTATSANFSGNVSVLGNLIYEDVVNVDSVGIATARSGLRITGGGLDVVGVATFANAIDANGDIDVDGHTELDNVNVSGVLTATSFVGNGTLIEDTVGIQSSGFSIGTSRYLNFVGTGNTFAVVGNRIDISISGNTGAGGTWNTYNAGIATTKSVGIHTSNLDNPALTGVGNSFQGLYISNGMIIHDNVLTGNHYIGTAYNGLMAGPVNVEGSLTIDGVWVVV